MDFGGKVVPGLQGANLRTVREPTCTGNGARANVHRQRCTDMGSAAMWATVFLGLAARLKDTCSVRFALHKSLKNQRIEKYVQVSCQE